MSVRHTNLYVSELHCCLAVENATSLLVKSPKRAKTVPVAA